MPYLDQDDEDALSTNPGGFGYDRGRATSFSPQAPAESAAPSASPTNFVNFDRIFNANADVAASSAKALAGRVGQAAQGAQDAAGSANDQYLKDLAAGAIPQATGSDQLYGSTPGVKRQEMTGDGPQIGPEASGPQPTNVDTARGYADSEFAAPKSLLETQYGKDAGTQVRRAQSQVNALSDSGLAGLTGGTGMDAALIGTAGRGSFDALRKKYGGLEKAFGDQLKTEGGLYDAAKKTFDTSRKGWRDAVGGYDDNAQAAEAEVSKDRDAWEALDPKDQAFLGDRVFANTGPDSEYLRGVWRNQLDQQYGPGTFERLEREYRRRKGGH